MFTSKCMHERKSVVQALPYLACREKKSHHETRILGILQFIHTHIWTTMFGRRADSIEKGNEADNEYMINDSSLSLTKVRYGDQQLFPIAHQDALRYRL